VAHLAWVELDTFAATGSGPLPDGKETEPWEIIYFKLYKGQLAVVERALEIAAMMLGSDKSRGYSLEMICADFLAGTALEAGNSVQDPESAIDCPALGVEQSPSTKRAT
jgi:hypothetical protein